MDLNKSILWQAIMEKIKVWAIIFARCVSSVDK